MVSSQLLLFVRDCFSPLRCLLHVDAELLLLSHRRVAEDTQYPGARIQKTARILRVSPLARFFLLEKYSGLGMYSKASTQSLMQEFK